MWNYWQVSNFCAGLKAKAESAWVRIQRKLFCGYKFNFEKGAKLIAIWQMAFWLITILTSISICVILRAQMVADEVISPSNVSISENHPQSEDYEELITDDEPENEAGLLICNTVLPVVLLGATLDLVLYAFLYSGIKKSHYATVNRCWMIMVSLAVVDLLCTIIVPILCNAPIEVGFTQILIDFFLVYSIFVVYFYKKELKKGAESRRQRRPIRDSFENFDRLV